MQPFFGKVVFVDECVEYGDEEVGFEFLFLAYGGNCFFTETETDSESCDYGNQGGVVEDGVAYSGVGVQQGHIVFFYVLLFLIVTEQSEVGTNIVFFVLCCMFRGVKMLWVVMGCVCRGGVLDVCLFLFCGYWL